MNVDVNQLAAILHTFLFKSKEYIDMLEIQGFPRLTIPILFLDLYFLLQERFNSNLMVRPISFHQEKLYMGARK